MFGRGREQFTAADARHRIVMQDLRIVSSSAFYAAAGLARVHYHYWYGVYADHRQVVDAAVAGGIDVADLATLLDSLGDPDADRGVGFSLDHVTASGRTSWAINAHTGVATVEVHRPSAAWCRWSALHQRAHVTRDDSAEDHTLLFGLAGPEPLRGDRVVLRVVVDGDHPERSHVAVVEPDALAARHVDDIVGMLSRWGALLSAQQLAGALPEWVRDRSRGLCVEADKTGLTLSLMRWGSYVAHIDVVQGVARLRLEGDARLDDAGAAALLASAETRRWGDAARAVIESDAPHVLIPSARARLGLGSGPGLAGAAAPPDLLIHSSPAELLALLRAAQAERDALTAEVLRLESRLTIAEIAIHTAQEEGRAPIWPPTDGAAS